MTLPLLANPTLSVVSPLYCEEGNVIALVERLVAALEAMVIAEDVVHSDVSLKSHTGIASYEIILVDDGSHDDTWNYIELMSERYTVVRGVKLSRNFGHQHALLAGLQYASGDAVVSLDGDLQHPPETIPRLVEKWKEGYAIVNTRRDDIKINSQFKRLSSKYFYRFFGFMTGIEVCEGSSDFRLLDRVVLDHMLKFNDVDLFLRGAVQWLGFDKTIVDYQVEARFSGSSKYSFLKMLSFSRGAILSFSTKPLMIGVWVGFVTSALAFAEIVYIFIQYAIGNTVPGWASTLSVLAFLFGILFIIVGIIGSYLARIYISLQNRPRFVTQKTINFSWSSSHAEKVEPSRQFGTRGDIPIEAKLKSTV